MRTISAQEITDTVARLCIEANTRLPQDVQAALDKARQEEPWPLAKNTLDLLWSTLSAAREKDLPICQDTGMACVFVELGTDVHIDGSFEAAIHEGVRRGYIDGYLRKSIVADPLRRGNTGDNTPAAITVHLEDGDGCTITEAPKGFFLDEKTYSFSIKEDGKTVVVVNEAGKGFVNQAQTGGIRIEKTSDDGVLQGFTFRVEGTDITGNAFSKDFVTDENGQIRIEGLRIGDYVISEGSNKANEKYELPANVTVTVHEGKTVVAKFHNKLKPVTDIPKTGDTTNMPLWAALARISAIGAGAAAFLTFRKKKEVGKHAR